MYERNRDSTASAIGQAQIVVQNSFVGGGAQATQLATENNVDIRDVLTWTHKAHTVTMGVAIPNMSRRGLDDYSNRLGTFDFSSLSDDVLGHPYSFAQQPGPVHFIYWQKEVGGFVQDQVRVASNLQLTFGLRWDWQNYLYDDDNLAPRASSHTLSAKSGTRLCGRAAAFSTIGRLPGRSVVSRNTPDLQCRVFCCSIPPFRTRSSAESFHLSNPLIYTA